jgi:hypothetical protein
MSIETEVWEQLKVLAWSGKLKGIRGVRAAGEPANERDHFYSCPDCGRLIDKRDLEAVLLHEGAHDRLRATLRVKMRRAG